MSTSQLRFRRKIGDALYGEVVECELLASTQQLRQLPPLPLGKRRIVAVKYMSLPLAIEVRTRYAATRVLDDPLQECHVADLVARSGGHRNIVNSYFHFQEHQCLYLIGEFCAGGDLYSHLSTITRDGALDERGSIAIMNQVFAGIDYLHRQLRIAHRDLSLENVLIHNGVCKISDFGLSVDVNARCSDRVGKEYYMAPEVVAGETYDPAMADIWSLGIMWFIMLSGSPLVSLASRRNKAFLALEKYGVSAVFESWKLKTKLSEPLMELVSKMLKVDPAERILLKEILDHPLFKTLS